MRGEIGISTVKSRVARGRLQYWRRIEQGENDTLRKVLHGAQQSRSEWVRGTRKYMDWVGIQEEELRVMSRGEVKRRVARKVEEEWRNEMEGKSTLRIYREFKKEMREEDYEGGMESRIWFGARTGSLRLGYRSWGEGEEGCRLCGAEREDDLHFILECEVLEEIRGEAMELQRPRVENGEVVVGQFLFGEGDVRRRRRILGDMWRRREREVRRICGEAAGRDSGAVRGNGVSGVGSA